MTNAIYLVRHAAPPGEMRDRYWGASDPGLDQDSLRSVRDLAGLALLRPDILFTSPLPRAAATARQLGDALGLRPQTLPELAEVDFGDFEGLTFAEVERRFPEAAGRWAEQGDGFAFPGGETVPAFLARAERGFAQCAERPEETVMCATHGGIIAVWRCLFLGLPLAERFSFRADYAALTAFSRKGDGSGWEMTACNMRK